VKPLVWETQGLIFRPDSSRAWMRSHAAVPTPLQLEGSLYRIFFSSRDDRNRSHIGFFDFDLRTPDRIVRVSEHPVLAPGPTGCFDADGVYAESVVRAGSEVRLYTIGVTTGHTRPLFYAAIGLATSGDGGTTFCRHSAAPIVDRSPFDPCLVTAPFVLHDDGRWRMWYVSGTAWTLEPHGLQSHYHVKYAESDDGLSWRREGRSCIEAAEPAETNVARLWVVPDEGRYRGWYSVSGTGGYRIGYAESTDGLRWARLDHLAGLPVPAAGWDAAARAYPAVVRHADRWFMFYNGNSFGRDGVGLAIARS
jgi:hypothetical protein